MFIFKLLRDIPLTLTVERHALGGVGTSPARSHDGSCRGESRRVDGEAEGTSKRTGFTPPRRAKTRVIYLQDLNRATNEVVVFFWNHSRLAVLSRALPFPVLTLPSSLPIVLTQAPPSEKSWRTGTSVRTPSSRSRFPSVSPNALGTEGLDEDENARLAAKRGGHVDTSSQSPGNFRAKTGKLGDVLERGEDGVNYSEDVATDINNDDPIEGTVVDEDASTPNNVVDGGLNLEASILAGAVDASFVDATREGTRNVPPQTKPVSLGDQQMDDLYAEIERKNSISDEEVFKRDTVNAGPTAPPVGENRPIVDQFGNPVVEQVIDPEVEVMSDDEAAPGVVDGEVQTEVEVMPEVGDSIPSPTDGAVTVNRRNTAMEDLMLELDSSMYDDDLTVETVQLIKVQFRIEKQVEFGEVLRMVGGHESMGAWSLRASPALKWSEGDVWVSEEMELPVDGVYVYKYVVTDASDAGKPVAWQKGNNQVLTLLASDAPTLISQDDWSGDPSKAYTMRPDGADKMQAETRLVQRLGDADAALHESRMEVMDLKVEVKTAQMQSAALREEARLSSNVRLKLKQQLSAEKKRAEVLEEQVFEWKQKFKQITSGSVPTGTKDRQEEGEEKKA